jgi:hypothetical protein
LAADVTSSVKLREEIPIDGTSVSLALGYAESSTSVTTISNSKVKKDPQRLTHQPRRALAVKLSLPPSLTKNNEPILLNLKLQILVARFTIAVYVVVFSTARQ